MQAQGSIGKKGSRRGLSFGLNLTMVLILVLGIAASGWAADRYHMPRTGNDMVGSNYLVEVQKGDTVTSIRHSNGVSYDELMMANSDVDFDNLRAGQKVFIAKRFILPPFRKGIVVNIPELRLYYFTPDGEYVYTFPVGLGRNEWRTPVVSTKVVRKKIDPSWTPPESIRKYTKEKTGRDLPKVMPPGPNNPLGKYAFYLGVSGYMIHGTNSLNSVGTFISSGCVRLAAEDVALLYEQAAVGTPVRFIYYPIKAGWSDNKLYLESHPPVGSYSEQERSDLNDPTARGAIFRAIEMRPTKLSKSTILKNLKERTGVPEVIGYGL